MPKVTFISAAGKDRNAVTVDGIRLAKGGPAQELTADQLERVRALPDYRFKVTGEKRAAEADTKDKE